MAVNFKDIVEAFDFVSFGHMYDHQAFLNKETGEIHWHSEVADDFEEMPEDLDDEKYIGIPHKNDLDLGRNLVLTFVYQYLPDQAVEIEAIFRRKGAYSRFKTLLERKGLLDKWYEYETQAQDTALRAWCAENSIETRG